MNEMSASWQDFVKCAYTVSKDGKTVTFSKGENPSIVAKGLGIKVDDLLGANPDVKPERYMAGTPYRIPQKKYVNPFPVKTDIHKIVPKPVPKQRVHATTDEEASKMFSSHGKRSWRYGTAWACSHPGCSVSFGNVNPGVSDKEKRMYRDEILKAVKNHIISHNITVDSLVKDYEEARRRAPADPKVLADINRAIASIK